MTWAANASLSFDQIDFPERTLLSFEQRKHSRHGADTHDLGGTPTIS